ncbi:helix-turn-helix domain-containing protein [Streptomyces sp. NPDC002076]
MQLRYAFRLDPRPGQCIPLGRALGCARVVYNDTVAARARAAFPSASALALGTTAVYEQVKSAPLEPTLSMAPRTVLTWVSPRPGPSAPTTTTSSVLWLRGCSR